jgi:NDT80 / PhoG like DNA-binding family.
MLAQTNESDLLDNTNKKVAPRSSNLFRVGPQFSDTRHHQDIYCKRNDMDVNPILEARVDRGFEIGENGTWIGYKRNYFTLVAGFSFENFDFDRFIQNKFYTYEKSSSRGGDLVGENKVEISYFAIRLVAKCSDDDVSISLVQHTAKRDKGPQFPPPIYPAVPGDMPDHETVKASCNKRNGRKIENMNKIFYFDRAEYYNDTNLDTLKDESILKNYPSDSIARVARFERIQFTSSIRIKSTSVNSRYFTLHVELLGIIEDEDLQIQPILLSSIETPPLIIRGRSPSNYHKERTSGYRGSISR